MNEQLMNEVLRQSPSVAAQAGFAFAVLALRLALEVYGPPCTVQIVCL